MKKDEVSVLNTGIKSGLIISAILIIYFLIMRSFHLTGSAAAWGFNFIIIFAGITFTYRYYRTQTKLNIEYLPGLLLGSLTTIVCTVLFTIFVYIYFSMIDPVSLNFLNNNILFMSGQLTPLKASAATLIEGICSGFIISFMMMQYYKSGFKNQLGEKKAHG